MMQTKTGERAITFYEIEVEHQIPDLSSSLVQQRLRDFRLSAAARRALTALILIGAALVAVGLILAPQQAWASLLLGSFLLLCLGLSGLFFLAASYLTGAGWSAAIRRIPEAMTSLIPAGAIGVGVVLILHPALYPWTAGSGAHEFVGFKGLWLNYGFFLIRAAVYVVVWLAFDAAMLRHSRAQDRDGNARHTRSNVVLSAAFVVVLALSFWLASVDWIMTLEPDWYSTIFGVYNFAGLFSSGIACMILLFLWLREHSALRGFINEEHLHDLGKLLLGFTTFWAYIWFSQYMLIWYANIPEETTYFVSRTSGAWGSLFVMNLVLNWVVPFLALLPRGSKRSAGVMGKVAAVVLAGRCLDLYLMIYPSALEGRPMIGPSEIGILFAAAGVFGLLVFRALGKAALLPFRDPYLRESMHYHQ